jgi:hypothetical protein
MDGRCPWDTLWKISNALLGGNSQGARHSWNKSSPKAKLSDILGMPCFEGVNLHKTSAYFFFPWYPLRVSWENWKKRDESFQKVKCPLECPIIYKGLIPLDDVPYSCTKKILLVSIDMKHSFSWCWMDRMMITSYQTYN